VFAHRGASGDCTENTVRAVQVAARRGADGLEVDVTLTADGTVVTFHDDHLTRLAGLHTPVCALTWDELQRVELPAGERVASLVEVLDAWPRDRWVVVELKRGGHALVERVLEEVGVRDKVVLSSDSIDALDAMRHLGVQQEIALVLGAGSPAWLHSSGAGHYGAAAVHLEDVLCTSTNVTRYREQGLCVGAWTINDDERARTLVRRGVTRIFTDWP
jgi:glycerophosphoryl diester phosphodiesterase